MGRIIAIANQKGGTAKTTSTINLGASLAGAGKKVLLADLDPQENLSNGLGIKLNEDDPGVYELLMEKATAEEVIKETNVPGLHLIPSSIMLSAAEAELAGDIGQDRLLKWVLREQVEKYDYIIIDTPPNLGVLSINALAAADEVIIPLQPQAFAMAGMTKLLEIIEKVKRRINPNLRGWALLLTMVDFRRNEDKRMLKEVRDNYLEKVFNTEIRVNSKLIEASRQGVAARKYDAGSTGAQEYDALARELLQLHGDIA
ncbi:ParA family protein [Desulforamulus aquiferis]|uniref:Sporulation initiation inhibitor protein Soj n=1 Tax=Desulforamulus aquiferis TaxID=1397668 RepID=A0AAW7ZBB8_9FIRM|nr:AAA family ATPase [Desulforamulus aquiferis]MDO7786381.1 AAA family ATPase [Desulforamulus aquiferis]